jgi:Protein of unknown function (DUF559)
VKEGIPVTSPSRTLVDFAALETGTRLARTFEEADRLGLLDRSQVREVLDRAPARRGAGRVRRLLREYLPPTWTRSELERRFLELCNDSNLPPPAHNVLAAGFEVDVLWPRQRLVVELDGYEFHRTRAAFERDRVRDVRLKLAGYEVVRITARRLAADPAGIAKEIRALLARGERGP